MGRRPEWVELIPAGPTVVGRDGRTWLFDDVAHQFVQTNFSSRAIDLPIDWEHATQRRAPLGQEAPAGAWIKQLEIRDGALWGLAEWTPRGELQLLGLPETATAEQVFTATTAKLNATNQALNTESGNLERFVPRADYNAVESRALNAEQALAEHKKTEHSKAVDAVITAATQAGKITPATVDYHRAMCQDEAGLTRFKDFVDAAPVVADPTDLGGRKPENINTALNSEEQAMCRQLGVDPVEFAKTKQSEV
ncbi:hypothetical protein L1887_59948 [Cichorium endivia]|nr:hypothetical protein L1887_59948 [Cichorium endivia]